MASVVYVATSTTEITAQTSSDVEVSTTTDVTEVVVSNLQGPQGTPGVSGVVSVVSPITNTGTASEAIIGINASSANTANYVVRRDANGEFVAGAVTIDTTKTPTPAPGKLYWDGGGTVNLGLEGDNLSVALGETLVSYVTNAEATTLNVGEVVYVFGAAGDRPSVKRASNSTEPTSSKTLGIVAESIGANQIGFVTTRGIINKLNLGSFTAGQTVYLGSTPGTFTSTKPVAPNHLVTLGVVLRANNGNGEIYVSVQNGFELDEIHDVLITNPTNGQALVYDAATDLWVNEDVAPPINPATPTTEGVVYGLTNTDTSPVVDIDGDEYPLQNTALGYKALDTETGFNNVAIGVKALENNTIDGSNNVAVGYNTLNANTTGSANFALGSNSLSVNTTGFANVGIGDSSLLSNTTGNFNTGIGNGALQANTTGYSNIGIGGGSAVYNTTGYQNTVIGNSALLNNTTGNNNTVIGKDALLSNVTGSGNVAIGYRAGYSETGSNKLYIANNDTTSLIVGDFSANTVTINGNLTATIDGGNA